VENIGSIDAKAILLPYGENDQSDLEEFDFDILYDAVLEVWVSTLVAGTYLIVAKSREFKELNEVISVRLGDENHFAYELIEAK
jgi:aspartokinase-like uncharacterized kinase